MASPVVTAILMILRLGIGLILLRLALRGSRNLHWLAACFYLNFLVLFLMAPQLVVVGQAVVILIQVCLAMFTHTTFYQNRRSPIGWVLAALLVGGGATLYGLSQSPIGARGRFDGLRPIFLIAGANWSWHALAAWQARRRLRFDATIEDWIKSRYSIVVAYAVLMSVLFLIPLLPGPAGIAFYQWAWPLVMMVSVVLQYLAWGMPGALKRYLNRNYRPPAALQHAQNMTEEELLRDLERQEAARRPSAG
jgi:hypothetical protein